MQIVLGLGFLTSTFLQGSTGHSLTGLICCQFNQHFMCSFCAGGAQKRKKTVKLSVFLCFWDLRPQKLHIDMLVKSTPALHI